MMKHCNLIIHHHSSYDEPDEYTAFLPEDKKIKYVHKFYIIIILYTLRVVTKNTY
jgi:hypothetical protein